MAKGSREQNVLRFFREADVELAEVLLETANRIVERRSKETVTGAPTPIQRGRKPTGASKKNPPTPPPDPRRGELPGTQEPEAPAQAPAQEEEREAAYATH